MLGSRKSTETIYVELVILIWEPLYPAEYAVKMERLSLTVKTVEE
jgi:hypothetical protein